MPRIIDRLSLFVALSGVAVFACGSGSRTFVLFAADAREDKDMARVPTVRLPLWNQPPGATIFCQVGSVRVSATRYDDTRVKLRKLDGSEEVVEVPDDDGMPAGLTTHWPNGVVADRCGLDPSSPIGSRAYVLWGAMTLRLERTDPEFVTYGNGEEYLRLHLPLTDADRAVLHRHAVPVEIVRLLH